MIYLIKVTCDEEKYQGEGWDRLRALEIVPGFGYDTYRPGYHFYNAYVYTGQVFGPLPAVSLEFAVEVDDPRATNQQYADAVQEIVDWFEAFDPQLHLDCVMGIY